MRWNHRVTREVTPAGYWYAIREVYYLASGTAWTEDAIAAEGESVEEVRATLQRMLEACDKPVLNIDEPEQGASGT